ncbi:MAG: hypothetical protein AMJ81_02725 [Phycisphaerae bacterium SM23_33]|jgi:uncharacterized protein (DUF58 family)|nr:MAG: hypothetical protein AMJ81_02725 [Phycisphaerae bacterium SM23_33]
MAGGKLFDDEFLRRLQRLGLVAKRISAASSGPGQRRSRRLGDGLEFADHRDYAPGDDIRFVDWPYYARMEKLLLRLFHEHSEGAVTILLDQSQSMALGQVCKFDYARRTAAALAYVAMASLDRVNILPFGEGLGDGLKTGRNRGQILQVLDFLEGLAAGGRTHLAAIVEQHVRRSGETGTVIVLTDAIDVEEDLSAALAALRQHRDEVICLHIVDRCDADPPMLGPSQLSGVEAASRMSLNVTEALLESYRQRWREFVRGVEKTCLGRGAVYVQAPTSQPFERLVLQALQRAGVLQA